MIRGLILSMALVGASRICQAQDDGTRDSPAILVPVRLWDATTRYRLVPRERPQPDTTTWTVSRRPGPDSPHSDSQPRLGFQVMVSTSRGRRSVDTVAFDAATLRLAWEHLHGTTSTFVRFDGAQLLGDSIRSDSTPRRFRLDAPRITYSSTMDNVVIQRLPLRPNYTIALPFWDGDHVEVDTVRVRDEKYPTPRSGKPGVWVVDFLEPYAIETLWVDRRSRRVTKHVYAWRGDGSHSEVVIGR
jgi:hypothetical protein